MVANPQANRQNAQHSTGPRTARGKAIASLNATKHGLLAASPPLIVGEDLETFRGVVQSLVDEHQPQGPTEFLLVQQLAMAHLRLHRLWGAEAAIARLEQLKLEKEAKTPELRTHEELLGGGDDSPEVILKVELIVLTSLINGIDDQIQWEIPKRGLRKWNDSEEAIALLARLHELLGEAIRKYPREFIPRARDVDRGMEHSHIWMRLISWQSTAESEAIKPGANLRYLIRDIEPEVNERRAEVQAQLDDLARIEQERQQAAIAVQAIPQDADRLARYERNIMRSMEAAIDRLAMLQERRRAGSMGSFGQN
ncbi:hypothetical protein [Leptolyngbya sp. FACHB-8]|uniref:hypothetical protein n=1 Tax=unclassified Leptolyngbya TaxID=2650499 RepID=UPI00168698FB|nr:hypothetical protein [Leptolyngbya sp. FACHB-8]MBD1910270.1 hypothetical protein [Leptolyngbya sp. FACHB-8]